MAERAVSKRELCARVADKIAEDLIRQSRLPWGVMSGVKEHQAAVLRGVAIGLRADTIEDILEVPMSPISMGVTLRLPDSSSNGVGVQPEY